MDEPYRALAFGVFYFFLLGNVELTTANQPKAKPTSEAELI